MPNLCSSATLALLAFATLSCGRAPAPLPPAPATETPASREALPPIPLVEGPLAPKVVYPSANAVIPGVDSNFIFGSLGNGRATLTINGAPVPVEPNGSFIAWLPVPRAGADSAAYHLVAALGADTARLTHSIRLAAPPLALSTTGQLVVDTASLVPRGRLMLRDPEAVRVSLRAPANAQVWIESGAARIPLSNPGDALTFAADVAARQLRDSATVVVARGADTLRLPLAAVEAPADTMPQWVRLGAPVPDDTDQVIIGRPVPAGTYKWFFVPGTLVQQTGRSGDFVRVRMDAQLEAWVNAADVTPAPPGTLAPRRVAGNVRVAPAAGWVDVVIPVGSAPPYLVEEKGSTIELTLYGTAATTDIINYARNDTLVRTIAWEPLTSDRVRYTLQLAEPAYGYLVFMDGGQLVLRIRRTPSIRRSHPLDGLTIAVDPGHPPIGATGPTGLYEAQATLWVGERLQRMLTERGARVVMTRTTMDPVALGDRPIIARRANADAFVSIHLNALPDGMNPFVNAHASGTYFFRAHSEPLARDVQRQLVVRLGLDDNGVFYDNLAVVRPPWMPAILCEGAFIMMPQQEAALRTPEYQERYARAIADGLEAYFRGMAR